MLEQKQYSSLKLLKHLDRLAEWDSTGDTYPVSVSIHLTNLCNNNCPLCIRSRKQDSTRIPTGRAKALIRELKGLGVKSIGLGGGGDPSCHPDFADLQRFIHKNGFDLGVYTNALNLSDDTLEALVDCCTWIRISLDADGPEIYKKTHGMEERAFNQVLSNIRRLVELKKKRGSKVTLGLGYLIGRHTLGGIYRAARLAKSLGMDHIRFRPFFVWRGQAGLTPLETAGIFRQLKKASALNDESFQVSFSENRCEWMSDPGRERSYGKCYAHHFMTIIGADLNVYPCCHHEDAAHSYGSLQKKSFKTVWHSKRRNDVYTGINLDKCPNPCMLDGHNKLLWEIKKTGAHSNFL